MVDCETANMVDDEIVDGETDDEMIISFISPLTIYHLI